MQTPSSDSASSRKVSIRTELTEKDIERLYEILIAIEQSDWGDDEEEGLCSALIQRYIAAAETALDLIPTNLSNLPRHSWEGMVCANQGCFHSSNDHAAQKGLCCRESCGCMRFNPSGKML